MLCYYDFEVAGTAYMSRICHVIVVYMLPVSYMPAVSYSCVLYHSPGHLLELRQFIEVLFYVLVRSLFAGRRCILVIFGYLCWLVFLRLASLSEVLPLI